MINEIQQMIDREVRDLTSAIIGYEWSKAVALRSKAPAITVYDMIHLRNDKIVQWLKDNASCNVVRNLVMEKITKFYSEHMDKIIKKEQYS